MIVNTKAKKSSKRKGSSKIRPERLGTPTKPSKSELSDIQQMDDHASIFGTSDTNIQDVILPEADNSGLDDDWTTTTKFLTFIDSLLSVKPPKWFETRPATSTDVPLKTKMVFENLVDRLRPVQLNRTLAIADGLIYKMSAPYRHMKFWKSTRHVFKELVRAQQFNIVELLKSISAKLISSNFEYNINDQTLNYVAALLIAMNERLCRTCRLAIAAAAHCLAHIDLGHLTEHNILLLSVLSDAYNGSLKQVKILLDGYESVKSILNLDERFPTSLRSLPTVQDLLKISEKRWQSMGIVGSSERGIWNQRMVITDLLQMSERDLAKAFISNVKSERRQSTVQESADFGSVPIERSKDIEESRDLGENEEDEDNEADWTIQRQPEGSSEFPDDREMNESNSNETVSDIAESEHELDLLAEEQPLPNESFNEKIQTVNQEKSEKKKLKKGNPKPLENSERLEKLERKKVKIQKKKRKREMENFRAGQEKCVGDSMGISKKKIKDWKALQGGILQNSITDGVKKMKIHKKKKNERENGGKTKKVLGIKRKFENSQQPKAEKSEKTAQNYLLANEKNETMNSVGRVRRRRKKNSERKRVTNTIESAEQSELSVRVDRKQKLVKKKRKLEEDDENL